jgi:hypothetical protein
MVNPLDYLDRKLAERGLLAGIPDIPDSALECAEGFFNQPAVAGFFTPEGDEDDE